MSPPFCILYEKDSPKHELFPTRIDETPLLGYGYAEKAG
jgi:hypothetical protein